MKRIVSMLLIGLLIINTIGYSFADNGIEDMFKSSAEDAKQKLMSVGSSLNESVETYLSQLTDIEDHWAQVHIQKLVDKGIVAGYPDGKFKPNASISVAEFAKILVMPTYPDDNYIQGIPWYEVYINKAIEKGLILPGEFTDYTREITRFEMARMIARAGEDINKFNVVEANKTSFDDDAEIAAVGKKYITAVSSVGIITGYPNGNFGPNDKATRAEACVMLNRFMDLEVDNQVTTPISKVDEILSNVKASTPIKPYTINQIQKMADKEKFGKIGTARFVDGKLHVSQEEGFMHGQDDLDRVTELVQVLAAHAEKNGHAIALTGGSGTAVGVAYGETTMALNNNSQSALFYISFYRDTPVFTNKEIDGVIYSFDENIKISDFYAGWHLENTDMTIEEQINYLKEREFMEENVLIALYDGLRTFDKDNAEALFNRIVADYRYSASHKFKTDEKNEFFSIGDRFIYKADYRGSGEGHVWTDYYFEE